MKKFIKLFFIFILSFIILTSCNDFVDYNTSNINVGGKVVTEDSNSGVADVIITDAKSGETVNTCSEGKWNLTITGRPDRAEIYAVKDGWGFSPDKQVINSDDMGIVFEATYLQSENQDTSDSQDSPEVSESFSISGNIIDNYDEPLNAVKLTFSNEEGEIDYEYSDRDGDFDYSGFDSEIIITPEKDGYVFEPEYRKAKSEKDNIDFLAIKQFYDIAGRIIDEYDEPLNGVNIVLRDSNNNEIDTVRSGLEGHYSYSGLEGRVRAIPEKEGYIFDPIDRTISGENNNIDFEAQRNLYSVSGKVYSNNYDPIPHVKIDFYHDDSGKKIGYAITDENGEWIKDNLWGTVIIEPQGTPENEYRENFDPNRTVISGEPEEIIFTIY